MDKIIISMAGSCGNQMFSYAFGYALAMKKQCDLYIETTTQDNGLTRNFEMDAFDLKYKGRITWKYKKNFVDRILLNKIRRKSKIGFSTKIYSEKHSTVFEPQVFEQSKNTYFIGNWQSEKYFSEYRNDILTLFTPKQLSLQTKQLALNMKQENSISVHIRRGDYLKVGCAVSMDYYDKAIHNIIEVVENPVFYIFSDDLDFCKTYFSRYKGLDIQYPNSKMFNPVIEDMYLMSCCKHNIMANSSYSWWGAWLNRNPNKHVICPELDMWTGDFYPKDWIKIKTNIV